ncbi:MAG: class I fructose-bisphosphate aldolase [Mycobacteriales bacterium]
MPELHDIATSLVRAAKGILAADESIPTMTKRLEGAGVTATADSRRDYREMLITTPGLHTWIGGVILSEETMGQRLADGTPFAAACTAAGIVPGIKVDRGTTALPYSDGGLVTEGLDGLRGRLESHREGGAAFAKWRAVLSPGSLNARIVHANAHALARYAALCQEAGIVPIVEPEMLMEGAHDIARCEATTAETLDAVFTEIDTMGVDPRGMILKPNMILAGATNPDQPGPGEVASRTVRVLSAKVPAAVPGIAFLSGGQSNQRACDNLTAINEQAGSDPAAPWRLTFSFGRALVDDALHTWRGDAGNVADAQRALADNCRRASAATSPSHREPAAV